MWRWDGFLHASAAEAVTLGEGNTPLLPAPSLGLGDVWIKDESRNPTWSFKDRLGSGALTMAKRFGAKVIASSSSGNAGASAAAYAAKAGMPCVVFTFMGSAGPLVLQMRAYGAMVVKVADKADRWRLQTLGRARVRLVSDLAVLRPGGRQQSLRHGRPTRRSPTRSPRRSTGSRPTGACCRCATAMRCSACGRASRS